MEEGPECARRRRPEEETYNHTHADEGRHVGHDLPLKAAHVVGGEKAVQPFSNNQDPARRRSLPGRASTSVPSSITGIPFTST